MRLVLTSPGREVAFTSGERIIGRGLDSDVILEDRSVSRHHALITFGDAIVVRDLDSKNGTWVNGIRIGSDRSLRHGDKLGLGVITLGVRVFEERVERAVENDLDDGWLAIQSAQLVKAFATRNLRFADEILFRLAEAFESRAIPFGEEATDAALAAVIDYASARKRPGWIRWASATLTKLGLPPGPAVRRSLDEVPHEGDLRSSGTVATAAPSSRRKIA